MKCPLPQDFVKRIRLQYPQDFDIFLNALLQTPTSSFRVNPHKYNKSLNLKHVPWHPNGYYSPAEAVFGFDPLWHAGAYYVQEASSMFLYQILKQHASSLVKPLVLDLCAAPGGKSTLLSDFFLPLDGWVVANEVVPNRLAVLKENLHRWGLPNVCSTPFKPQFWSQFRNQFDVVLVDAPCSGEGLFRKDPKAQLEWSEKSSNACSVRQLDILNNIMPTIKNQGLLIYSTCTFNPQENESVLETLANQYNLEWLPVHLPNNSAMMPAGKGYAFLPHKVKGEGFFIAVARVFNNNMENENVSKYSKPNINLSNKAIPNPHWFESYLEAVILELKPQIGSLFCPRFESHYQSLQKMMPLDRILQPVSVKKGNTWAPTPESGTLLPGFKSPELRLNVSLEQALRFIAKADPIITAPTKDYYVLSYKGVDLGWIKALGNRNNNLYPQAFKLKSTKSIDPDHLPQSYFT